MSLETVIIIIAIIIVFLALFDILDFGTIFEGKTRQTPHGPVLSRCAIYGGRFYGLGGKCGEPLIWPDIFFIGLYGILFYTLFYNYTVFNK